MSGGRWDYKQFTLGFDEAKLREVAVLMEAVAKVLREIDWAECGDSSRKDVEPKIYDLLLEAASSTMVRFLVYTKLFKER